MGRILIKKSEFHPFPTIEERAAWDSISDSLRNQVITRAELFLACNWPTLPAVRYMDFTKNGNRRRFEALYFQRRNALGSMVIAECMEGEGRFLEAIMNGIWSLCEESSWCIPAHNDGEALPDINNPIIDLFAGETAALLTASYYLLGTRLDAESPLIRRRIDTEIKRRLLDPFLERNDFWWMGLDPHNLKRVNNWNPWIHSNCLAAFLLLEDNEQRRTAAVQKSMTSLDVFLDTYPPDGGCDEGPMYWNVAGGAMFDCLEWLYHATEGRISFYDRPLIRNMGRYIYRSHIHKDYFVNFSDCNAKADVNGDLIARFGKRIKDTRMTAMGASLCSVKSLLDREFISVFRVLPALFHDEEWTGMKADAPYIRDVWLKDTGFMVARERAGTEQGLFLAAKGGHNDESHNHNDVGSFIVYADGLPFLIDLGTEYYTARSFSSQRYEIWTTRSNYHNLPAINGEEQQAGTGYRASDVKYEANDEEARLSLDIAGAYSEKAGIIRWQRTFYMNRADHAFIHIEDEFRLTDTAGELVVNLMTPIHPNLQGSGIILLKQEDNHVLKIEYDDTRFKAEMDVLPVEDARLKRNWGDNVYRIRLSTPSVRAGKWSIRCYLDRSR